MIPQGVHDFVKKVVEGKHTLNKGKPIVPHQANVLGIIETLVTSKTAEGTGVITKREIKGVSTKDSGKDKTLIRFAVSDGENSVQCVAHNCNEKYGLGTGLKAETLTAFDTIVRKSLSDGQAVKIKGLFANFKSERVFVIDEIMWAEDIHKAQIDDKIVEALIAECAKTILDDIRDDGTPFKRPLSPLDVMLDNEGLWADIYADNDLKEAIMLYCLSPFEKEDMIHIGLITNPGEGKNHLVDKVINPLVRCRMAGTGKLSTFAAMFGAMSSDDLNSIELGLLPKMNNDRIVFSEFQTLEEDVFGEMLNVMTDGHYNLQKGKLDVTRHAMLNMAFFGNPPNYWNEKDHKKEEMLGAFGKYTMPIISRLTLIFAKPTLTEGLDASTKIKEKILANMDKKARKGKDVGKIKNLRLFFREYLKLVSRYQPELTTYQPLITSLFGEIEAKEEFKDAFAKRGKTDYRKWAEFLNLVKGFARLRGKKALEMEDVSSASDLFQHSLETLTKSFSKAALNGTVDYAMINLNRHILKKFKLNDMQAQGKKNDIIKFAKTLPEGYNSWVAMTKMKRPCGGDIVEDWSGGEVIVHLIEGDI
jgi:DNA replicative helicase MCM subunit Mcm2 (Cdc46/Mcm family)